MDPERRLQIAVAVGSILVVSFPVHEFSHALAAFRLGDSTARFMGRLTLNPVAHFDPLGAGMLAISSLAGVGIGWAKPTPVNPVNLDFGRRGEAIVAAAGPISNLILAALAAIPLRFVLASGDMLAQVRANPVSDFAFGVALFFVSINAVLFVFNLLPIPPLDGWKVFTSFLDARTAYNLRQYEQYGFVVLLLLVFVGGGPLLVVVDAVVGFLLGI